MRKMFNRLFYFIPEPFRSKIKYHKYIRGGASVSHNVDITNSTLGYKTNIAHHASLVNSNISDYSSIGRYSKINNVVMGKFCSIAWDVTIGATSHPIDRCSTHAFPYIKQFGFVDGNKRIKEVTSVGNDVWVGCQTVIMSGLKIGNGAVIGAGAVVTKDVPDYAIVVGAPARILKYRFSDEMIVKLNEIAWWNWDYIKLKKNISLFQDVLSKEVVDRL